MHRHTAPRATLLHHTALLDPNIERDVADLRQLSGSLDE
jgi:hypothetical protein